jgi:hypothetical protein
MMTLRQFSALCLAAACLAPCALASSTVTPGTLKDLQTVGSTTKKQKKQQYDLVVDTASNEYVCRTKLGEKVKATDWVIGSSLQFKLSGQNGEATTATDKHIKCGIVRVAPVGAAAPAP